MKKTLTLILAIAAMVPLHAQKNIYHDGWIDFNKNGRMDVYEDPSASIDDRIEDLLSQMNLDEKTCQMATLYGYRRVLQDQLPTPEWKNKLWKDGIGAIDEHLNSFVGWNIPLATESPYIWPPSKHAWALNQVQKFFVEETRLGIPVDFTDEGIRGVEAYKSTNFPTQLGLGSTWDRELIYKVGEITGSEARLLGYTNVYVLLLGQPAVQRLTGDDGKNNIHHRDQHRTAHIQQKQLPMWLKIGHKAPHDALLFLHHLTSFLKDSNNIV